MNLRFVNKIIGQILIGLVTEQILALVKNNPSEEDVTSDLKSFVKHIGSNGGEFHYYFS